MIGSTSTERTIPYAKKSLIYIPGLGQDQFNSTAVVAESIARTIDRRFAGSVSTSKEAPVAPKGLIAVCTLISAHGERLFDIYELDYRDRLEDLDRAADGKEGTSPGTFSTAWYALSAFALYCVAITRRHKSKYVKAQLLVGMVAVVVLVLAAIFAVAAIVIGAISQFTTIGSTWKDYLQPVGKSAVLAGLVSGATYLKYRNNIVRSARRLRQLMTYCQDGSQAANVTAAVADGVDSLRDLPYDDEIHLLAYSFGSLVLLDELIPFANVDVGEGHWVHRVTSITTIGCPIDFLRLYYPKYYRDRTALRTDLPWQNIFIASDIFGSNFVISPKKVKAKKYKDGDGTQEDTRDPIPEPSPPTGAGSSDAIAGVRNGDDVPGGMEVKSTAYLRSKFTFWGFISQTALRQHERYWSAQAGCWDLVDAIIKPDTQA